MARRLLALLSDLGGGSTPAVSRGVMCAITPDAGLGIAVNQASAAERFDLALDTPVRLEPV